MRRKELGTQKLPAVFLLPMGGGGCVGSGWAKEVVAFFLKNMGLILSHYSLEVDLGPEKIGYPNRKVSILLGFQPSFLRGELLNFGGVGGTILR